MPSSVSQTTDVRPISRQSRARSPKLPSRGEGESFRVLGVPVDAVQISDVITRMEEWIAQRGESHFVVVANVHVVMEARHDPTFRRALETAALRVPDGMPLIWVGRVRGHRLRRRVYGPDLLLDFCQQTKEMGYRHFFYGGAPGVAEALSEKIGKQFPRINVVGNYSPPFRPLSAEEDAREIEMIRLARPDILWVGLGCPKQERWMADHRDRLGVPVMVGVGQAFDIHSGRTKQAPRWLREHGLEWLYRLVAEPRRLWRRYLVYNSQFIFCEILESLGLKHFG